ncbi:GHKL domain-containing protein [Enterococcus crotali]|uniref:GHKL domain-containing protein n=1 Tax=Enterococcus crotali TaxID=1453587 RepID=UPI00046F1803|nr:GHKL domain-containing protein [Enterococcus crotali]
MEPALAAKLFAISYLQIIWVLLYQKYISKKQSIILSIILSLIIISSFFNVVPYLYLLLFIFYTALAIFIVYHVDSWILMVVTLFLFNSLVILSWLFTYDLLNFLFQLHIINAVKYQSLVSFSLFGQQAAILLLSLATKKIDDTYLISDSILHIRKRYKLQSAIALFFLILFIVIRQLAITYFFVKSFFYLTFLLLTLCLIVYSTAYLYSKYYQQQQKKEALFKQYNQELEKIVVSDEFRHDYRNILLSLTDYVEQGKSQEALQYIDSISDYSKDVLNSDPYMGLDNLSIPPLQGLLMYLVETCKQEQLQLHFDIPNKIQEYDISIRLIDLLRCLSALSEYAVKETKRRADTTLYVSITKKAHQLHFVFQNKADQSSTIQTFDSITTKKYYKEHGLYNVMKIINQYNELNLFLQSNKKNFSILLTLQQDQ